MAADPDLPAEHHVVADLRAAGDADLRRHQHVASNRHAVRDLHEVVDLGARLDARLPDGRPIDGRVRAKLHVVFEDDGGDLRDLFVGPVAAAHEAVAVAADHHTVLQDDAIAEGHAFANRDVRVDDAVRADARTGADRHVGVDDRSIANCGALADRHKRRDRHVCPERGIARDGGHRVNTGRRLP